MMEQSSSSSSIIGSEQAYSVYAMHFISLCSHALQSKPGLNGQPVVDMCARIEDCIYNKALTAAGNPPALWHSDTAPIFYRELCESAMLCLEDNSANIDWRKMYNESKKNVDPIFKYILSRSDSSLGGGGGGGGKSKKNSLYANSKFNPASKKTTKQVGFSSTNLGSMANKPPSQMQMATSVSAGNFNSAASTNSLSFSSSQSNFNNNGNNNSNTGVVETSSSSILWGNNMELNEMESISLDSDMLEPMSPVSPRHKSENSQSSSSSGSYTNSSNTNINSYKNSASSDNLQELQQQQIALDQAREEARKKREEQLNVMINPSLLNLDDDDGFF